MFKQAVEMTKGKSPEEMRETVINLCKTKGIDFKQIQDIARSFNINL